MLLVGDLANDELGQNPIWVAQGVEDARHEPKRIQFAVVE